MEPVEGQFNSGLEAIVEFLYRSENNKILFRLQESESIVHHWVKQFAREFGAIIEVFET